MRFFSSSVETAMKASLSLTFSSSISSWSVPSPQIMVAPGRRWLRYSQRSWFISMRVTLKARGSAVRRRARW